MKTLLMLVYLLFASLLYGGEVRSTFIRQNDIVVTDTAAIQVSTVAKYSDLFRFGDSSSYSIAVAIETTEAVSVIVGLEVKSVMSTGATTWETCLPAVFITITNDIDARWKFDAPRTVTGRLKFNPDTLTPLSAYEVRKLKLFTYRD